MSNEEILELKNSLLVPKEIVILSHRNPDGDAVGSSLGLALLLQKLLHKVKIVLPSEYPAMLNYLPNLELIEIFDLKHDACREIIDKSNMIFLLDFNGLDRIDKLGENVQFSKATKVMIDHHIDPEPIADYVLSETQASSTCELVYKFITDLGYNHLIDEKIGQCLFTGLITDTGSFKFATRPYTYQVAAELKEKGVNDYELQNNIFNSLSLKQLRLLGHCLANRMEVIEECGSAFIFLTKEDYIDYSISRGDTEGIVNYMLLVKDIKLAALISEQANIIKISLRSKGDINVQSMASTHFRGGGHKNASGGAVYAKLEDVIKRFKRVVPEFCK